MRMDTILEAQLMMISTILDLGIAGSKRRLRKLG